MNRPFVLIARAALAAALLLCLAAPSKATMIAVTPSPSPRVTTQDVSLLRQMEDRGNPLLRTTTVSALLRLEASDPPTLILDVFHLFAQMRYSDGAADTVLPAVERMLALARVVGDDARAASLDALAGEMQFAIERSSASRQRIEAAISQLRTLGRTRELARELAAYAMLLPDINEYATAMRQSNEAVRLVAFEPDPLSALVFGVLYAQVEMLRLVGDAQAALSSATALLARAERSGNAEFVGFAQHSLARTLRYQGDKVRAAALLDMSFNRAKESGNVWEQFVCSIERIELALESDAFADARRALGRVASLRDNIDDPLTRAQYDLFAASVLAREGNAARARATLTATQRQLAGIATHPMAPYVLLAEADVLASEGRAAAALKALREGVALRQARDRANNLRVLAAQAELHRLSERELREAKLTQEARLSDSRAEAVEQRLLNQRLTVAVAVLAMTLAAMFAAWQVVRARRFRRRADYDGLTGALSRSAIGISAAAAFAKSKRTGEPLTIMLLDVDNLKWINDTFGHARGDDALRAVARLIAQELDDGASVARWGGDEFVLLLPDASPVRVEQIRKSVWNAVRTGLRHAGFDQSGASIGVASISAQDASFEDVLARADAALYEAKAARKALTVPPQAAQPARVVAPTQVPKIA